MPALEAWFGLDRSSDVFSRGPIQACTRNKLCVSAALTGTLRIARRMNAACAMPDCSTPPQYSGQAEPMEALHDN
jgi:hypothetical protein